MDWKGVTGGGSGAASSQRDPQWRLCMWDVGDLIDVSRKSPVSRADLVNSAGVSATELKEEEETLSSPLNINARP